MQLGTPRQQILASMKNFVTIPFFLQGKSREQAEPGTDPQELMNSSFDLIQIRLHLFLSLDSF
jgi:hypothetical protein